jgi:colanic acid biosynthesis glycosyl transferase WcaI
MNILIVTQYFWPENFRITHLAQDLANLGHKITILTGKPNYPSGIIYPGYRALGIQQEYLGSLLIIRSPLIPRGQNSKIRLSLNYLSFVIMATFVGALKKLKSDVIFVYGPSPITVCLPAIFLKKLTKVPLLFWVQDLWPESVASVNAIRNKLILQWLHKLVHFIYHRCDYILTSSQAYFSSIKKYTIDEKKLRYFPQSAEPFYQPLESSENPGQLGLPKGFRILFSGNLGIAQNLELILDAAELVKENTEIKWIFIGDGSKRRWLQNERVKRQLTDTVFWLGFYPPEKMPYFFSQADTLLITLRCDTLFALTIPAKLQSYLACAKPIVAVLQGEGKRIIEEAEAGLVSANEEAPSLVETVLMMKNRSNEERKIMGQNGRDYFKKHFHRDMLLKKLEQWMKELTEKIKQ